MKYLVVFITTYAEEYYGYIAWLRITSNVIKHRKWMKCKPQTFFFCSGMSIKYVSIFKQKGRVTSGHVQVFYRIYTRKHAREYGVFSGQPHDPILLHWNGKKMK